MKDKLLCILGRSGSGKTTIAEELEKRGFTVVQSYTTRKPRFEGEKGHTFVTDEELDKLENILAYNEYNGARYCTTMEQIDNSDVYVVDIPGLKMLREKYHGPKRIIAVGLMVSEGVARDRMLSRGDSDEKVRSRISEDNFAFADLSCCDMQIDASALSPSDLTNIIDLSTDLFPSTVQMVKVQDLCIGDSIWLGETFYIVEDTLGGRIAIPANDVKMSFSDKSSFSWKESKVREYLNETYLYKILNATLGAPYYNELLGIAFNHVWDKVSLMTRFECKKYFENVPKAFGENVYLVPCNMSTTAYLFSPEKEKDNKESLVKQLMNIEAPNEFSMKPKIVLDNNATVILLETNNAG